MLLLILVMLRFSFDTLTNSVCKCWYIFFLGTNIDILYGTRPRTKNFKELRRFTLTIPSILSYFLTSLIRYFASHLPSYIGSRWEASKQLQCCTYGIEEVILITNRIIAHEGRNMTKLYLRQLKGAYC